MKRLLLCILILTATTANAAPVRFQSLAELKNAHLYRLTCSDNNPIQAHIYIEVYKQTVATLKIITIAPAESLYVRSFTESDLSSFTLKSGTGSLTIAGTRPGVTLDEEFELILSDSSNGVFSAELNYDDFDGMGLRRITKCAALDHIIQPSY